jgi:hypothetical protein
MTIMSSGQKITSNGRYAAAGGGGIMIQAWKPGLAVVSTLMIAVGCKPTQPHVYSGSPSLTFVRATSSQLQFRISNQSGSVVRFRGSKGDAQGADPWDSWMECKAADAVDWDAEQLSVLDGDSTSFEVAPGENLLIRVSSDYVSKFRKGRCRLNLLVFAKLQLVSNEFEP